MICRLWRGWATHQNADAYERIVRDQVIPDIEARRIPGFRAIDLIRRERERDVEFMTLMWFDSLDAVKAFMGDDYEAAHVPTEAQAVLADFDKRSAHYQVLDHRHSPDDQRRHLTSGRRPTGTLATGSSHPHRAEHPARRDRAEE